MAVFIKSSPVLTGQSAVNFDREADRNKSLKTPKLSDADIERLERIIEKSRKFKF